RHALKNRIVLAVDRNEFGTGAANLVHHDLAGQDQSFLVGKQDPLGGPGGGKRRRQAGRTDDGRHHRIDIVGGDRFGERFGAALHAGGRAAGTERLAGQRRRLGVHEHHRLCLKLPRLLDDRLPAAVGSQHRHPEPLRMQGNHAERAAPDAPGGTENGESERRAHAITPEPNSPSAYKGAAAVTLSMRSSRPPCPGSSAPSAPSRVLPGLTRGASFRLPKLRPAKYAPTSAAITNSTSHSTACGPCAKPRV